MHPFICSKGFLLGLFLGELFFGGAYYWKEFCISKWVGPDNKTTSTNSPWACIWKGSLSEGFLRLRFGGLTFFWGGGGGGVGVLIIGILQYVNSIQFEKGIVHVNHALIPGSPILKEKSLEDCSFSVDSNTSWNFRTSEFFRMSSEVSRNLWNSQIIFANSDTRKDQNLTPLAHKQLAGINTPISVLFLTTRSGGGGGGGGGGGNLTFQGGLNRVGGLMALLW